MSISATYQPSAPVAKTGQGSAISNREDLSNELTLLAPEETPLLSLCAKGKANAEDALAKYPDLGCMVGLFAYNPPLLLEALSQAGKLNQVKVVAFDEDDATLDGIQKGTVHGTVVQNPYMYGYKSVEVLNDVLLGKPGAIPASKFIDIPARQIRKDTVDAFWTDLKSKVGGK